MTSSTFSLYARCISECRLDDSECVVAVPRALETPVYTAVKSSFLSLLTTAFENKVVYASPASRTLPKTPKDFYMPNYLDVELDTPDGKKLHGWLILRKDAKNVPCILHFHGNACTISHMLYDALGMYQKVKASILLVDYRGYGLSHGAPSQEGLMMDAEAALGYLYRRRDVIDPSKIFLFGRSLGGAVAIALAVRHQDRIRGIIVENTFTSMDGLVSQLSPAFAPMITRMTSNKWNSEAIVGQVHKPILFLSGRADEIVPCSMMTKLYRAASNSEGRELAAFPKGKHNSTCLCRGYYETIKRFVDRILLPPPSASPSPSVSSQSSSSQQREGGRRREVDSFMAATSLTLQ